MNQAHMYSCDFCPMLFRIPSDLKLHMKKRHERKTNRVLVKQGDFYPCYICRATLRDQLAYKRHIFLHHSNEEVVHYFNRSMREHLNKKFFKSIRAKLFYRIEKGDWEILVRNILEKEQPFDTTGFDYKVPVDADDQDHEAVTRRAINATQMDLLKKLGDKCESQLAFQPWLLPLYVRSTS